MIPESGEYRFADYEAGQPLPSVDDVVGVEFDRSQQVSDQSIFKVADLTNLQQLNLAGVGLPQSTLSKLATLKKLKRLNLSDNQPKNALSLSLPEGIEELDLTNCPISDLFVSSLSRVENLQRVNLTGTDVSSEAIERLKSERRDCEVLWDETGLAIKP